jgi:hypothetical protein
MIAEFQKWITAKWRQLTKPLESPSIRIEDENIIYECGHFRHRLPIAEILKIEAFERNDGLVRDWGAIYTGQHNFITVSEGIDGFIGTFDEVAEHLGFDGRAARDEATQNARTDPAVVKHYPIYDRPSED